MSDVLRLKASSAGVLVIDIQERLIGSMPRDNADRNLQNVQTLLRGARTLGVPVLISEQYPKGLGPTLPEILEAAGDVDPMAKTTFSCWEDRGIRAAIETSGRTQWLIVGMETHICVYLTARDLVDVGLQACVISDGCLSRNKEHFWSGLDLCSQAGVHTSNVETVLFEMIGGKQHESFKEISRLIR
ncbi:MAG: isochorismatase family protein [Myxococcota bacterium]|nr:isochorismatase family protein [Myxococcota bacterium]